MNNTKKKIMDTALDLFSKKGYNNVSIRDICKVVGIKESSLYYHFINKQEILDELILQVNNFIEERRKVFTEAFSKTIEVTTEAMCQVAAGFLKVYLCEPLIYKMISLLTIERMADEKAAAEYQRLVFELPLEQQTKTFSEMIERGFIRAGDPEILAQEYYSVIYFAFQKNCMGGELTDERMFKAFNEIRKNIGDIYTKMR